MIKMAPRVGLGGWGEKKFSLKVPSYSYKSNDTSLAQVDIVMGNYSFFDIFGLNMDIFEVKKAPRGFWGLERKKNFRQIYRLTYTVQMTPHLASSDIVTGSYKHLRVA